MPGGVSSPVRAFRAVGGDPLFIARGAGAWIEDADGNRFVDYVLSWGPLIAGHAHPGVIAAVTAAAARGTSFGAPCAGELELARRIQVAMPSIEMLRFVSSGTEAVMSAVRLARAATGREAIVKFEGCYHGHADAMLVRAGSGVATLNLPDSPGVPEGSVRGTLIAPYNDVAAVEALCASHRDGIAAILVEPVAGNMGLVPPVDGFLSGLRRIADRHGALLVFDEVMTGFRVHPGGAQALFGVRPDLTILGKVIGGGLPAAAYGGRRDLLERVAPSGPVYQAGTLSGNPVAMAAGCATLDVLAGGGFAQAAGAAERTAELLRQEATRASCPVQVCHVGAMVGLFFKDVPVRDWASARASDTARFARWHRALLEHGVYWPPSQFESAFTSSAHGKAELVHTAHALRAAFAACQESPAREVLVP